MDYGIAPEMENLMFLLFQDFWSGGKVSCFFFRTFFHTKHAGTERWGSVEVTVLESVKAVGCLKSPTEQ